jgi:phosphoglycerate kinase
VAVFLLFLFNIFSLMMVILSLHPGLYHAALESPKYYLFTGGGTVLKVLEEADPFGLPTVKALIENGEKYGYQSRPDSS